MSGINVRYLKKSDSAQVAPLIFRLTKNVVEPEKLQERIEALATNLGSYQFFVAEKKIKDEWRVIGFGGLVWYQIPSKGLTAWYEEIVVDEAFERQGVATEIMKVLDALAKVLGAKQIKLTTDLAQGLYESNDFKVKEEVLMIKKYY